MATRRSRATKPPELPQERTDIDFLVLADFAEVVNGKLYLMGGGWARFNPPTFPAVMRFGLAVGVRVPYLEAEMAHSLQVVLRGGDGQEHLTMQAEFETGRPPGTRGDPQLVPLALNGSLEVKQPDSFEFVASVDGVVRRRYGFRAIARPIVEVGQPPL